MSKRLIIVYKLLVTSNKSSFFSLRNLQYFLSSNYLQYDDPSCFVCGKVINFERCHIIPKSMGGSDSFDNKVILCNEHHREAPNFLNCNEMMLDWIQEIYQ